MEGRAAPPHTVTLKAATSAIAMPPLSPVRVAEQDMGASPFPLEATRRPTQQSSDYSQRPQSALSITGSADEEALVRTNSMPNPASAPRRNSSLASILSNGVLPDGFYYYYGPEEGLDSPSSESYSASQARTQPQRTMSAAAAHQSTSDSGSARAYSRPSDSATPPMRGHQDELMLPRHRLTDAAAHLNGSGSAFSAGGGGPFRHQLSQNSLLSVGAASSHSPRSPAPRYRDSSVPSRPYGEERVGEDGRRTVPQPRGTGVRDGRGASLLLQKTVSAELSGSGATPCSAGWSPLDAPAPGSRSPVFTFTEHPAIDPQGHPTMADDNATLPPMGRAPIGRKLFETEAVRGVPGMGLPVERVRYKPRVPAAASGSSETHMADGNADSSQPTSGDLFASPSRTQPQEVVPRFRISPHSTALSGSSEQASTVPVVDVNQLRRDIVVQHIAPRVQSFLRSPGAAAGITVPTETIVFGYSFSDVTPSARSEDGAATTGNDQKTRARALPALTHIVLERVSDTEDATSPRETTHMQHRSDLVWGESTPAQPENDLLLLGGAGEELLRLGDTDLHALTAAATLGSHTVPPLTRARKRPAVIADEGVLMERACVERSRGLLPWTAMLVASQAAARHVGQRLHAAAAANATSTTSEVTGEESTCTELTVSVFVRPLHVATGAASGRAVVVESNTLYDLLRPLDEVNLSDGYDRRARLVSVPAAFREAAETASITHLHALTVRREEEVLEALSTALACWYAQASPATANRETAAGEDAVDGLIGHLHVQFDLFGLRGQDALASPRGPRHRLRAPLVRTDAQRISSLRIIEMCSHILCEHDTRPQDAVVGLPASVAASMDTLTAARLARSASVSPTARVDAPRSDAVLAYLLESASPWSAAPMWVIEATSSEAFMAVVATTQPLDSQQGEAKGEWGRLERAPALQSSPQVISDAVSAVEVKNPSTSTSLSSAVCEYLPRRATAPSSSSHNRGHEVAPQQHTGRRPGASPRPEHPKQPPVVPRLAFEKIAGTKPTKAAPTSTAADPSAPKSSTTITHTGPTADAKLSKTRDASVATTSASANAACEKSRERSTQSSAQTARDRRSTPRDRQSTPRANPRTVLARLSASPNGTASTTDAHRRAARRPVAAQTARSLPPHTEPASAAAASRTPRTEHTTRTPRDPGADRMIPRTRDATGRSPRSYGTRTTPKLQPAACHTGHGPRGLRDGVGAGGVSSSTPRSPQPGGEDFQRAATAVVALESTSAAAHIARMAAGRERRKLKQKDASAFVKIWSRPPELDTATTAQDGGRESGLRGPPRSRLGSPRSSSGAGPVYTTTDPAIPTTDRTPRGLARRSGSGPLTPRSSATARQLRPSIDRRGATGEDTEQEKDDIRSPRDVSKRESQAGPTLVVSSTGVCSVSPAAYQRMSTRQRSSLDAAIPQLSSPQPRLQRRSHSAQTRARSRKPVSSDAKPSATRTPTSRTAPTGSANKVHHIGRPRTTAATPHTDVYARATRPQRSFERMHSAKPLRSVSLGAARMKPEVAQSPVASAATRSMSHGGNRTHGRGASSPRSRKA